MKYVECTFAASKVERMNYVGADRQKRNMYLNISPKYVELLHKVNIYTLFFFILNTILREIQVSFFIWRKKKLSQTIFQTVK